MQNEKFSSSHFWWLPWLLRFHLTSVDIQNHLTIVRESENLFFVSFKLFCVFEGRNIVWLGICTTNEEKDDNYSFSSSFFNFIPDESIKSFASHSTYSWIEHRKFFSHSHLTFFIIIAYFLVFHLHFQFQISELESQVKIDINYNHFLSSSIHFCAIYSKMMMCRSNRSRILESNRLYVNCWDLLC